MKDKRSGVRRLAVISFIFYSVLIFKGQSVLAALEDHVFIEDQYGDRWKPGEMTSTNIFSIIIEPTVDSPSEDSEKLIAPGTSGSYSFTVHNNYHRPINYKLIGRNENKPEIPLEFKLRIMDGPWIKGEEETWSLWSDTFPLNYQRTLLSGSDETIQVMWQWPFERDRDAGDTLFGQRALSEKLAYQLTLNVVAEENTKNQATEDRRASLSTNKSRLQLPKTGESLSQGGVLFGIFILVFVFFLWRVHQGNKKCE
ncbi:LPXTG cell wall anchor domain-containing protein [Candidatus Enterococcus ferrettii]|uniref:Gram-positive cocci surface proteins LPxTG domain-containing protein n=1 Tax=Candidatus Enterococcus ferrettii TaxID=2815324 RepID=A0ABV0EUB4_9ENTE|nr:LPXTG cell wall anchor domain-containing protein [Enterococcus sp. 665A]MBO1339460.1 LPXTG cell wall anchor domain-containing protein [Enterococcus sp. 665A]